MAMKKCASAAAAALAEIGPTAKVALPDIEKLLRDPVFLVRVLSAAALWKLSGSAEPALTSLQESFDHVGGDRGQVVEAIGSLGFAAKAAVPLLLRGLDDKEWSVRLKAVFALAASCASDDRK